jgi:ATP-dependent DNA ligase
MVEYHIYDYPSVSGGFNSRWAAAVAMELDPPLVLVKTETVDSEDKIMGLHAQAIADGYEGLMVRNSAGAYEGKRSYNLQKIKEFDDAEFKIIGVNEGRGKLAGHAATFTCVTSEGSEFEVKLTGDTERLKDYLRNDALWRGKWLTVKYQGFTNSNNVPRFPVGISIRDYE